MSVRRLPTAASETGYAHVTADGVVAYYADVDQAVAAIQARHGEVAIGYFGLDPSISTDGRRSNPPRSVMDSAPLDSKYAQAPYVALERTTLPSTLGRPARAPLITGEEVMAIDVGQAHAVLAPHFLKIAKLHTSARGAKAWETVTGATRQFLRTNIKTEKSREGFGALAVLGLSLVPHRLAFGAQPDPKDLCTYGSTGKATLCYQATKECACVCLVHTGNNANTRYAYELKYAAAQAFLEHPIEFCRMLVESIEYWRQKLLEYVPGKGRKWQCADCGHRMMTDKGGRRPGACKKCGGRVVASDPTAVSPHRLVVRLNMLSDVPWELVFPDLFNIFSDVIFYDYTKVPGRVTPPNYDLTFSYSGTANNIEQCRYELTVRKHRIGVVFLLPGHAAKKSSKETEAQRQVRYPLPKKVGQALGLPASFLGLPVKDGDLDDLRFLDPKGIVVGLRYKDPIGQSKTVQGVPKVWAEHRDRFDPREGAEAVKHFVVRYALKDGVPVVDLTPLQSHAEDENITVRS